jgi:transcriptional regulator with XRE-family HTH domain
VPEIPPLEAQETVGARLKRLRLERGLSQRELAGPGVSYAYISRIEAGTRQPSVKALRRLAAKLGVNAAYLETGSDLEPSAELELRLTDLELAVRLGNTEGAEAELDVLLEQALAAGDRDIAVRARVALAILARERGRFGRMVELLEAAIASEPFAPVERVDLYGQLGYAYVASGRSEAAVELYRLCLDEVRRRQVPAPLETRYATLLSYALSDAGDVAGAEQVVSETLDRVRDTEDAYTRVRLYWSLARVAPAEGRPGPALVSARRAIALLEATEDTINLARAHLLAAGIMITRGDADAAGRHLDDVERLLGSTPSFSDAAMLRIKRAQVAALRGDGSAAIALARAALAEIGDRLPGERGSAYFALAEGLALAGATDEADEAFTEAVKLLEQQHQWREATQACRAWARLLRTVGREQRALDVLDRAAELGLRAAPADAVRS